MSSGGRGPSAGAGGERLPATPPSAEEVRTFQIQAADRRLQTEMSRLRDALADLERRLKDTGSTQNRALTLRAARAVATDATSVVETAGILFGMSGEY